MINILKSLKHQLFLLKINHDNKREAIALRESAEFKERYASLNKTFTHTVLPSGPFIWGITMVKNEADIVEQTIRHLLGQGVDHILAADNGSSDGTYEILLELSKILPVHVIQDRELAYYQSEKMTWLADRVMEAGAEWKLYNVFPSIEGPTLRIDPTPHWDLKVCFSRWENAVIKMGNHEVIAPGKQKLNEVAIIHYPWRSKEQFARKLHQGAKALEATDLPEDMGYHWRRNGDITVESATPLWEALLHGEVDNETITWHPTGPLTPIGSLPQEFKEIVHLLKEKTSTGI